MEDMKKFLGNIDDDKLKIVFQIKNDYHDGKITLEEGQRRIKTQVKSLHPHEIAYIEQAFKEIEDHECQKEDIQQMLALFDGVMSSSRPVLDKYHPIECYYRENEVLKKILLEIEDLVQYPVIKNQWKDIYERLSLFRIHLSRKQNQLYALLERKGFDRPTTTMWTLDDFIRDEIKEIYDLLDTDEEAFIQKQATLVADIRDLMDKEELVLYPTALEMISSEEFEEMKIGDREIGFAWIQREEDKKDDAKTSYQRADESGFAQELAALLGKYGYGKNQIFDVATGRLTLEQINLIYRHLPVDISYVDENEIVCFYSDTQHRVFPRSKNVIGRDVKNCHPRKSVHIVEEIIEKFRSGEEDTAEFWINKPELFIYIYYVAVRDEEGRFKGVLEMMQDCTHIRSLEGSRTLVKWGSGTKESVKEVKEGTCEQSQTENKHDLEEEIELLPETKLSVLLEKYPWLKEKLPQLNPAFKMLQTPLARLMIPKATIQIMSERSNMPLDELMTGIKSMIDEYERR